MKTQRFLTLWLFLAGLLLGCTKAYAQWGGTTAGLVLVSSTDFSVSGSESEPLNAITSVNGFKGIFSPKISIGNGFSLPSDVYTDPSESTFLSGKHYGISYRSHYLDTLRFARTTDDWGIVFSSGNKNITSNTLLLTYRVGGLKNGGKYRVELEVCNPHSASYLEPSGSNKTPHLREGYHLTLKIGTNNYQNLPDGFDVMVPNYADSSRVYTISSSASADSRQGAITNGTLNVNVYMSNSTSNSAVKIKSIKVYAEVDPMIFGQSSECVGGKKATFRLMNTYKDCKYQWYKDGKAISGATGTSYTHTTGNVDEQNYSYYCEITTAEGEKIKSKTWTFVDRICCIDDNGKPIGEKLIWQDDFGTFTEKGKYWVWDYSDINNPKKVEKTTANGWTYGLSDEDETKLAASYPDDGMPFGEGTYSVAANVTCVWDGATDGTMWEWQAYTFNGKTPEENGFTFAPDHTYQGTEYGAMLFLNCGNEPDSTIYERTIENLPEKELTVKCYMNNWSASVNETEIYLRVTDLNSNESVESEPQKRYPTTNGIEWVEVSASIALTGENPKMKFEIISKAGGRSYNVDGNDLLLDDIQVWTCDDDTVKTNPFDGYDPVIVGQNSECIGGMNATFKLKDTCMNCKYQWYKDGKAISGATEPSYTHTTGKEEQEYTFYCEITSAEGEKIKSKTWTFVDRICCIDDNGKPIGEKLIWQDDFGTFTEKGKYWVWDYSDINNPKKVEKTTANGWTYGLSDEDETKLAASYPDDGMPFGEGTYSVAANVTCVWDGATDGTMWEWQAYTFNGKTPEENGFTFAPDHTYQGTEYGAMLFLNCGNEPDSTIYERTIENLPEKEFTVKCYMNNWGGSSNPSEIYLRITDLNSGIVVESDPVNRYSISSGLDWVEASAKISLTGSKMKFEIVSKVGGDIYNREGNDLLLDDIQIWTCDDDTTKPNISDCPIIGQTSECVGGKKATFGLKDTYTDCTYQWYKDGKAIRGATEPSYTHTTGNVDEQEYEFYCEITTATGEKGKSKTWKFKDRKCCIDDNGNPITAEKLVWQDDFGTFTEEGQYWVWDYSDINNPVKVEKTTKDGWTYELPYEIPGAEYVSEVFAEGTYSVAANVTCVWDDATDGTKWEWQAYTFNGETPKKNGYTFAPDHTYQGTEYGAMLFLNCGNEANTVIYERTITDLSEGEYTAKCYINNWSQSTLPVAIAIRVTDLNSAYSYTSETIERYSVGEGVDWKEVSAKILLTGDKPGLKLEIISVAGGDRINKDGNDLLLDDIQLWTCDPGSLSTVESIAANDDEIVNVYTISGALVKSNVKKSEALKGLSNGSYIVGNEKMIVR